MRIQPYADDDDDDRGAGCCGLFIIITSSSCNAMNSANNKSSLLIRCKEVGCWNDAELPLPTPEDFVVDGMGRLLIFRYSHFT